MLFLNIISKSSHRKRSVKKGALKNFENFTEKNLRWSLVLIKFIKKRLQHRSFTMKYVKFLRTTILKTIDERLFQYFFF